MHRGALREDNFSGSRCECRSGSSGSRCVRIWSRPGRINRIFCRGHKTSSGARRNCNRAQHGCRTNLDRAGIPLRLGGGSPAVGGVVDRRACGAVEQCVAPAASPSAEHRFVRKSSTQIARGRLAERPNERAWEISECFETPFYYLRLHTETPGAIKSEPSLRIRHTARVAMGDGNEKRAPPSKKRVGDCKMKQPG
jgi:hypothetical protein